MTTGQYINLDNAPDGSTVEHRDDGRTFVWYPKGERVTVKLPLRPAQDDRTFHEYLDDLAEIGAS